VRAGIALYGLHVSDKHPMPEGLSPVMTWKTVIAQVKTLPPGHVVGYGGTYRTRGKETVAILCVGYADGYRRSPRRHAEVLIHGKRAPVIGRISMEKTVVSVTHIPEAAMGDEVVLLGKQGHDVISAEEIAKWLDTSNYEVVCGVLPRVPRR
jgi:alanine racemase